jgi:hypothetical protein
VIVFCERSDELLVPKTAGNLLITLATTSHIGKKAVLPLPSDHLGPSG